MDETRPTCDKCENAKFEMAWNIHGCTITNLIIRNYYQAESCLFYNERKEDG